MIQREMPDTIVYVCSDCGEETEHQILKGRMGKATLEGTFRCNECGKVTSETIRIPEIITVPVIYSDGDVSVVEYDVLRNRVVIVELDHEALLLDEYIGAYADLVVGDRIGHDRAEHRRGLLAMMRGCPSSKCSSSNTAPRVASESGVVAEGVSKRNMESQNQGYEGGPAQI